MNEEKKSEQKELEDIIIKNKDKEAEGKRKKTPPKVKGPSIDERILTELEVIRRNSESSNIRVAAIEGRLANLKWLLSAIVLILWSTYILGTLTSR